MNNSDFKDYFAFLLSFRLARLDKNKKKLRQFSTSVGSGSVEVKSMCKAQLLARSQRDLAFSIVLKWRAHF